MEERLIVLVTGATGGIGKNIALRLARQGCHVFATGRRTDALNALIQESGGLSLDALRLDVTDRNSIAAAKEEVDRITDGYGLDVLINNAGFGLLAPMEMIDDEDMRRQFDTNVFGLMAVTQAFLPAMRERRSGRIINISSLVGKFSPPMQGIYSATKHAVEAISDSFRRELGAFGIDVVIVEPGAIVTGFEDTARTTLSKYQTAGSPYETALDRYQEMVAATYRYAPGPECVARTVAHAVKIRSPAARYVSPRRDGFLMWILRKLPTRLVDFFIRKMLWRKRKT